MSGQRIGEVAQQVMGGGDGVHFVRRHHVSRMGMRSATAGCCSKEVRSASCTSACTHERDWFRLRLYQKPDSFMLSRKRKSVSSMVSSPRPSREEQVRTEGVQPGVGLCR